MCCRRLDVFHRPVSKNTRALRSERGEQSSSKTPCFLSLRRQKYIPQANCANGGWAGHRAARQLTRTPSAPWPYDEALSRTQVQPMHACSVRKVLPLRMFLGSQSGQGKFCKTTRGWPCRTLRCQTSGGRRARQAHWPHHRTPSIKLYQCLAAFQTKVYQNNSKSSGLDGYFQYSPGGCCFHGVKDVKQGRLLACPIAAERKTH